VSGSQSTFSIWSKWAYQHYTALLWDLPDFNRRLLCSSRTVCYWVYCFITSPWDNALTHTWSVSAPSRAARLLKLEQKFQWNILTDSYRWPTVWTKYDQHLSGLGKTSQSFAIIIKHFASLDKIISLKSNHFQNMILTKRRYFLLLRPYVQTSDGQQQQLRSCPSLCWKPSVMSTNRERQVRT